MAVALFYEKADFILCNLLLYTVNWLPEEVFGEPDFVDKRTTEQAYKKSCQKHEPPPSITVVQQKFTTIRGKIN